MYPHILKHILHGRDSKAAERCSRYERIPLVNLIKRQSYHPLLSETMLFFGDSVRFRFLGTHYVRWSKVSLLLLHSLDSESLPCDRDNSLPSTPAWKSFEKNTKEYFLSVDFLVPTPQLCCRQETLHHIIFFSNIAGSF